MGVGLSGWTCHWGRGSRYFQLDWWSLRWSVSRSSDGALDRWSTCLGTRFRRSLAYWQRAGAQHVPYMAHKSVGPVIKGLLIPEVGKYKPSVVWMRSIPAAIDDQLMVEIAGLDYVSLYLENSNMWFSYFCVNVDVVGLHVHCENWFATGDFSCLT